MRLLFAFVGVMVACLTASVSPGAEGRARSILMLDQGGTKAPFYHDVFTGLRAAVAGPDRLIAIYAENLDLSRFTGEAYRDSLQAHLQLKYRDTPIDVVVAVGSATLDYVLSRRAKSWPGVPVVFAMVDEPTIAGLNLPSDVTGVVTRLTFRDMMIAARALVPGLDTVVVVGDRPETQTAFRHFYDEILGAVAEVKVIYLTGLPMTELRRRVGTLPEHSAILYTSIISDGAGINLRPVDAVALIAEAANRPIVVAAETFIGPGGTGGFVATPSSIGAAAGKLTLRVLDGEQAAAIPIAVGDGIRPIFDWRQLERWGVSESALPPGSEIRFRAPGAWERYRPQIMTVTAVILIQATLIAGLLVERRRRRTAEVEARHRLAELAHINRRATVGEMSASIAHELNQPLSAILANAETAESMLKFSGANLDEIKEILGDIRRDDERASEIIRRLRRMLTKRDPETLVLDINETVLEVIKFLSVQALDGNMMLTSALAPGLLLVRGDRIQLQQVILNLIVNGMEATAGAADGERKIIARSRANGASVNVSIADSGHGIPSGKLKEIFQPFFTTKEHGMGMGLSISRTIMEAHEGRVWAENLVGGGAVFHLSLPLAKEAPG